MGEKDHTQKMLIGCRDVFAELINVLVYSGEKVVNEADLLAGPTESLYIEADNQTHQQLRDCSMYELHNGEIHALYNLENQSIIDAHMPLRCAGYDGAAYRSQCNDRKNTYKTYPVFTFVLNWSRKPWNKATSILEALHFKPNPAAYPYFNNNKMSVFNMCFLSKDVREKFQGDLRIILDYLCDRESLLKRNQTMKHPEEVIRMLHALTGDDQYLNSIPLFTSPAKKGESTVCDLINSYYNEGHNTGLIEGRNSGLIEGRNQVIQALISNCKDLGCSFENTLDRIKNSLSLSDDEALEDMKLYW
ncbi:MAG TPA: hypothetical protein DFI63_04485 [Lachnospiraceae bacterium]|nr:hypothetical protein [Lachnospiraceae bacterium]